MENYSSRNDLSPRTTSTMTDTGGPIRDLEDRLSILTSLAAVAEEPEPSMAAGNDDVAPAMVLKSSKETQQYTEKQEDNEDLSPSSSSISSSSSSSPRPNTTTTTNNHPRRSNDRTRLTSIARTAVRATKEQFWDSNEPGIVVAQTAVDRWEEIYMWSRNVLVKSSRSVTGIYDASKAGARGLDRGLLVPLRDYVLLPTFGVAEHIVSETSSFVQSPEAETIRRIAAEGSSKFVANTVPFGLGETVVLPAVRLGSETIEKAWNVARYPVPSQKNVRDTVDFLLNGSKKNLSLCGSEIVWYFRRADANIARTLRRTQWVVLGSGPYETLDAAGRQDIMDHVCERYLSIGKGGDGNGGDSENDSSDSGSDSGDSTTVMVARYEFMANVRACNRSLYRDLVETGLLKERGGASTIDDEWLSERPRYRSRSSDLYLLGEDEEHAAAGDKDNDCITVFALWFRLPFENGKRPKKDVPWIHFDPKDGELLEEKYRSILKQQSNSTSNTTTLRESSMPTVAAAATATTTTSREEGLPPQEKSPQTKPTTRIWESPKYATNAKWYNPDLDRDVLLDQKRHAVTFIRCSPESHKQQEQQYDEGEKEVIAQQQSTSEGYHECIPSQEDKPILDGGEENESSHQLVWEAERLFALPPPLLGVYRPTMWRSYGPDEIRRAVWFLDTPRNGPQPYGEDAQALLEDAYQFLKWKIGSNQRVKQSKSSTEDTSSVTSDDTEKGRDDNVNENVLLTVQVSSPDSSEQQLVQFTSLTVATAIGKGLGGALSLFKRRVYRGAYNYISQDEDDDVSRNKKCVEEDVPRQIDEDSGWTTTTEDALEKLSLTFSTKDFIIPSKESDEENINIEHKDCFKDSDQEQVFEETTKPSLNQNECPSSTNFENRPYDDGLSLAFQMVSSRKNLADIVDDGPEVDHLILVVHGIGEMMQAFDLFGLKKVPTLADCCGYLRDNHAEISDARFAKLSQINTNHMKETNKSGRVEYLPIEWHEAFSIQSTRRPLAEPVSSRSNKRSSKVSVDDISLRTIPTLRSFANDTLMDILYFMSPAHHDIITDIVSVELNFIVKRFRKLTGFKGDISIIGHSIGSVIAWDILDHQQKAGLPARSSMGQEDCMLTKADDSYRYPQLNFKVDSVYLLGSPIPVFLMIRNQEKPLTKTFTLNGCRRVFNIFHPYDPVSYRIEPLIHPRNSEVEPNIMIHWNGGFRFQYQTKRLWKKIVDQTLRAEENVIHSLESGIKALGLVDSSFTKNVAQENDNGSSNDQEASHLLITGALNGGRRIDYMLQEKEIDRANEYVAALAAHSCYWLEKDLSLFIANEICIEKERKQGGNNIL